ERLLAVAWVLAQAGGKLVQFSQQRLALLPREGFLGFELPARLFDGGCLRARSLANFSPFRQAGGLRVRRQRENHGRHQQKSGQRERPACPGKIERQGGRRRSGGDLGGASRICLLL